MASPPKPAWARAQEAKALKEEEGKQLAFKQAFEATFADVDPNLSGNESSDEDAEYDLSSKPIGPVDPGKCTATGTGVGGGVSSAAATIIVTAKDSDGRRLSWGGAQVKVQVAPGFGVAGPMLEPPVVDQNDGTYITNYTVYNRGNYMVSVEVNGRHITGSPIPVFFGAQAVASPPPLQATTATPVGGGGVLPGQAGLLASGALQISVPTGLSLPAGLGNLPGILPGPTGGAVLPGVGAQLGEVCRMYLDGKCKNTPCRYAHPTLQQLMTAFASGANMGSLTSMPMAPSAAAMAAAQSIAAAQALQRVIQVAMAATAGQDEADEDDENDANPFLDEPRALKVRNLSPSVNAEQVRQLFGYCGKVVECSIADGEAYVEFEKPEEATAALQLNGIAVGDREVQVEHTKLVLKKKGKKDPGGVASSLQLMQQAIQLQQMQYQQALAQQTLAAQQMAAARNPAKMAADTAKARALELSKQLKALGGGGGDESDRERGKSPSSFKSYSPPPRMRSPSPRRRRTPSRRYPSPRYGRDGRREKSRDRYESRRHRSRDRLDSHRDRDRDRDRDRRDDYDRDRDRRRYRSPDRTSRRRPSRSPSRDRRSSRYRSRDPPRSRDDRSRRDRSASRPRRDRSISRSRGVREERKRSPSREERRESPRRGERDERKRSPSRESKRARGAGDETNLRSPVGKRRSRTPERSTRPRSPAAESDVRRKRSRTPERRTRPRSPSAEADERRKNGVAETRVFEREGKREDRLEAGDPERDAGGEKRRTESDDRDETKGRVEADLKLKRIEEGKQGERTVEDLGIISPQAKSEGKGLEGKRGGGEFAEPAVKAPKESGARTPKAKKSVGKVSKEAPKREESPGAIERALRAAVERSMRERRAESAKREAGLASPPAQAGFGKQDREGGLEGQGKEGGFKEKEKEVGFEEKEREVGFGKQEGGFGKQAREGGVGEQEREGGRSNSQGEGVKFEVSGQKRKENVESSGFRKGGSETESSEKKLPRQGETEQPIPAEEERREKETAGVEGHVAGGTEETRSGPKQEKKDAAELLEAKGGREAGGLLVVHKQTGEETEVPQVGRSALPTSEALEQPAQPGFEVAEQRPLEVPERPVKEVGVPNGKESPFETSRFGGANGTAKAAEKGVEEAQKVVSSGKRHVVVLPVSVSAARTEDAELEAEKLGFGRTLAGNGRDVLGEGLRHENGTNAVAAAEGNNAAAQEAEKPAFPAEAKSVESPRLYVAEKAPAPEQVLELPQSGPAVSRTVGKAHSSADVSAKGPALPVASAEVSVKATTVPAGKALPKLGGLSDDDDMPPLPSVRRKEEDEEELGFGVLGGKRPLVAPKVGVKPVARKGVKVSGGISFKLGGVNKSAENSPKPAEGVNKLPVDAPEAVGSVPGSVTAGSGPVEGVVQQSDVENGGGLSAADVQQGLVKAKEAPPVSAEVSKELADLKRALIDEDDDGAPVPDGKRGKERHAKRRRQRSESSERERTPDETSDGEKKSVEKTHSRRESEDAAYGERRRHRSRSDSRRRYEDRYREERFYEEGRYGRDDRYRRERYEVDDGGRYQAPDSEEERREKARREGRLEDREEGEDRRAYLRDSDDSREEGEAFDSEREKEEKRKRQKERRKRHKRSKSKADGSDEDGEKDGGDQEGLVPYSEDEGDESRKERRRKRKKERKGDGDSSSGEEGRSRKKLRKRHGAGGDVDNGSGEEPLVGGEVGGVSDEDEDTRRKRRKERKKRKHRRHHRKDERSDGSENED